MAEKPSAMVLASFAADSLALGVHWIYNTNVIDKKFGRVETYLKPERPTYHPTKMLGEFTHYGDQTMILLESVSTCAGFDLADFSQRWQSLFENYDGYLDSATKGTLENIESGKPPSQAGSESDDLAGAARIAPLLYVYRDDLQKLIAAAEAQTAFTHNNLQVIKSAAFFSTVTYHVLKGASPLSAIASVKKAEFNSDPFSQWIDMGLQSIEQDTRQAILDLGQMCETAAAFPGVIHLIAKYENDLKQALVENVMAGGDSAARGLIVGMVLGAHLGMDAVPQAWIKNMKAYQRVTEMLAGIDRASVLHDERK
ncbi:MAG: ADP-ribosylglycohydrolase family protein [Deltaproteobacteria bacterium]|jgi:ADP-ribosylglycohydrolase|nr:ADP-ribosylglycohydrolase family protein [Deltaproteobacteria bacterium]